MLTKMTLNDVLGRGVYGSSDALRLVNFGHVEQGHTRHISPSTIKRWLRGYDHVVRGEVHHSAPLWQPDYSNDNEIIEVSFRDLIELRFVKAFRDLGLGLPTIRECFKRAVEEIGDERPFSTQRFRTDGKTIFLEITHDVAEGELIDLKKRQNVFQHIVAPSLRDLEFDADVVARWFPLGASCRSVVIDPARAFGRPILSAAGVPTEVIAEAVKVEGSEASAAKLYDVPIASVRDALSFERKLAA
jgi:uncharacterized protein (DUF433 family)